MLRHMVLHLRSQVGLIWDKVLSKSQVLFLFMGDSYDFHIIVDTDITRTVGVITVVVCYQNNPTAVFIYSKQSNAVQHPPPATVRV